MIGPITPEALADLVKNEFCDPEIPGEQAWVFDLRTESAFQAGHVAGARHLPHQQVVRWVPQRAATHALVVLVDDDGAAFGPARETAAELVHHWFRRVRYLKGGYNGYRAAGLPSESGGVGGATAGSSEGATAERLASSPVEWKTPDLAKTPRVI